MPGENHILCYSISRKLFSKHKHLIVQAKKRRKIKKKVLKLKTQKEKRKKRDFIVKK